MRSNQIAEINRRRAVAVPAENRIQLRQHNPAFSADAVDDRVGDQIGFIQARPPDGDGIDGMRRKGAADHITVIGIGPGVEFIPRKPPEHRVAGNDQIDEIIALAEYFLASGHGRIRVLLFKNQKCAAAFPDEVVHFRRQPKIYGLRFGIFRRYDQTAAVGNRGGGGDDTMLYPEAVQDITQLRHIAESLGVEYAYRPDRFDFPCRYGAGRDEKIEPVLSGRFPPVIQERQPQLGFALRQFRQSKLIRHDGPGQRCNLGNFRFAAGITCPIRQND